MVKSYLRYVLEDSFGTVASRACRSIIPLSQDFVITGHDETVSAWNCRTGEAKVHLQAKPNDYHTSSNVTCFLYTNKEQRWIYAGYSDGSIRRFELNGNINNEYKEVVNEDFTLQGHKGAVTCLSLSPSQQMLASGSQDCSIILWDTAGDLGLFKLEGHKNEVSDLRFVKHNTSSEGQVKSRKVTNGGHFLKSGDDILGFLISISKDCIIRIWDLTSQLCIQTVIHSTAELYGLAINSDESRMYASGAENQIRCYKLDMSGAEKDENSPYDIPLYAKELPALNRPDTHGRCRKLCILYPGPKDSVSNPKSGDSVKTMDIEQKGLMLCVTNHFIVFYRLYDSNEAEKRKKRRHKRVLEKQKARCNKLREAVRAAGRTVAMEFDSIESEISHLQKILSGMPIYQDSEADENSENKPQEQAATDEVNYMFVVNALEKIASFQTFSNGFAVGHANNTISVWRLNLAKLLSQKGVDDDDMESLSSLCERVHYLNGIGHHNSIVGLSVSPNDMMIASLSADSLKVWNSHTHHCVRTVECKAATCAYFVAGNKHVLVGTGSGELQVVYLDTCEVQEVFKLSPDSSKRSSDFDVVCMAEHPGHFSFAAAFRDRSVRLFEYVLKKKGTQEVLTVKELSNTSVPDDPTDIKYSNDGKLLAVSLHNNNIQTFYTDSMKMFLSLYGHKLPVTSIDISSDGTLLASSSLDKTVKIWGLDYGNIHRSLLGHANAVLKCRWINDTHYLITAGMDAIIKVWDCDTYDLICQLRGHNTAVRSIALSSDTHFFVSASDYSTIRLWKRSEEQIFLSEEREKELELQLEHEAVRDDLNQAIPVDRDTLNNKATRKTMESVKATEQLMQIIDEAEQYRMALEDHAKHVEEVEQITSGNHALSRYGNPDVSVPKEPDAPLELFNRTPTEHVMMAVCSLNHSVIHEVLIALPFIYAEKLLYYITKSLETYKESCLQGKVNLHTIEIPCKAALLLVQIYFRQFYALRHQRSLIAKLEKLLPWALKHERERLMQNKTVMEYLKTLLDADDSGKRLRGL